MDGRSILLAFIPVALTLINYAIIRDLLWGILLGSKSQKSAEKIRSEAEGWAKFSQRYIGPHLTKFEKDYKTWMNLKVLTAIAVPVQIAAFVLMIALRVPFWIVAIVCGVIVVLNIVLFTAMMSQTAGSTEKESTKGSPWKYEHAGGQKKTPKAQKKNRKK